MFPRRPFLLDRKSARSWIALVALAAVVAVISACSGRDDGAQSSASALAQAGRWTLPASVATAGEKVRVTYDEAPRWTNAAACAGKLKTGGAKLGEYLVDRFDVVTSVGGYACRRNTADRSRMSVHGTGRALDVFIPKTAGAADNGQGDKVANWLVMNAQRIGVQLVIWDRTIWRANGTNDTAYGGPHPHDDHLHVELSTQGAAATTPWFSNPNDDGDASTDAGSDSEAGRADASTSDAGLDAARPDTGGGTVVDSGKKDAAPADPADDDYAYDAGTGTDAAATPKDTTPEPPATSGTTPPSEGLESAADEPGETDSLPESSSTPKRREPTAAEDEASIPTDGCSATSRSTPSGASGFGAFALALGLVAMMRRKRR